MSDNPMKDYVLNFRANLPSGVTYDSDIARYFVNEKRFLNEWEAQRYIDYIQKFGFSVSPITATTSPQIGPLTDGDTLSTTVTWGSYASSEGTITGTVREMSVNGGAFIAYDGTVTVSALDTYRLRETVSDDASNSRAFFTAMQAVAGVAPTATNAPVVSGGQVGSTPSATPGTYSGAPAPTVLGAFTLDGAAFDPPTELQPADEGKTLIYTETASNGVSPDATQIVVGTVGEYALTLFEPTGSDGVYVSPRSEFWQDETTATPATAGQDVGRWEDRSGTSGDITQATAASRATLSGTDPNRFIAMNADDYYVSSAFIGNSGTISLRFKNISDEGVAIGARAASGSEETLIVSSTSFSNGGIRLNVGTQSFDGITDVLDGLYHTATVTWNNGSFNIYVDGSLENSGTYSAGSFTPPAIPVYFLRFNSGGSPVAEPVNDVSHMLLLNRAITSTEAQNLSDDFNGAFVAPEGVQFDAELLTFNSDPIMFS